MTTQAKLNGRRREALDLLVSNMEREIKGVHERMESLVASIVLDAQNLAACQANEGPEALNPTFLEMHTREITAAKAELSEKRRWLRDLKDVIAFA